MSTVHCRGSKRRVKTEAVSTCAPLCCDRTCGPVSHTSVALQAWLSPLTDEPFVLLAVDGIVFTGV